MVAIASMCECVITKSSQSQLFKQLLLMPFWIILYVQGFVTSSPSSAIIHQQYSQSLLIVVPVPVPLIKEQSTNRFGGKFFESL